MIENQEIKAARDIRSEQTLNQKGCNLRWYNSCIQALKIKVKYSAMEDEDKAKFNEKISKIPLDDDQLRLFLKEELDYNQYQKVIKKTEDIIHKKEVDDQFRLKEAIQVFNEDYIEMAEKFYIIQPYYYDKYKIWWLWNFEKTCWEMVDVIDLLNQLKKQLSPWVSITKTNVFSQVQRALEMVGRGKKPEDCSKNFIQFKNKIYDLATKRTYPVKSSYFATNPIPWEIGESIETPIMDQLFKDWVGEKYVQTLYEIIAYCCYSDYPIHLIFCFIGVGRNGKTKYQQLISRFLGENNISSTELDLLLGNRFESIKLFKKLACTLGETNFGVMSKTSLLKKLSGQDLIGFEMKNKTPFDGYNYAKIIINSNSLPSSEDTSEGFYRRWFIIDFPNQFPEGNDILNTIPDVEYNNLALKVIGILPKLLESGQFTNQGTIEQRRDQYVFASNPLEKFIDTWCEESGEYVRYSTLYTAYIKFLKQNKRRIISKKEFTKSLDIQGFEIRKTNKKIGDVFVNDRFVEGLELKDKALDYGVNMILPHFL